MKSLTQVIGGKQLLFEQFHEFEKVLKSR